MRAFATRRCGAPLRRGLANYVWRSRMIRQRTVPPLAASLMQPTRLLCTQCGSETSAPLKVPPGSPWVALALAVPFVIPGIVYAVWRYSMRRDCCPTCGHAQLIPGDAPLARTWRSAGWIAGRPVDQSALTPSEVRLDRIEQAIDAIAAEVDRVSQRSPSPLRTVNDRERIPLLRDRGTVTPT